MPHQTVKGKTFTWHHLNTLVDSDFEFLQKNFTFHPLDFDDIRESAELPKVDVYKHYVFAVFTIPFFDKEKSKMNKKNLAVFVGKDYVVTVTSNPVDSVERLFARAMRSRGLRQEAMGKTSGYFLYKLLDYVFRDVQVILQELVRETQNTEISVYDKRTEVTTKRLGMLRSNILYFNHLIDPQRMVIPHLMNSHKAFLGKDLEVYFDDVKDTLDRHWIVTNNLRDMVESLFSVNEAFLTHKTNAIIRILTVISVLLMPPTLITSYYGMNVLGLPYAHNIQIVSLIVVASLIAFFGIIIYLDKRH